MLCVASDTQSMMSDETNLSADGQDSPPDMDSASGIPTLLYRTIYLNVLKIRPLFSEAKLVATQLSSEFTVFHPVFLIRIRIRIRRIRMFLGLLDPDPLVRVTDPDHCIIKQK